MIILKKPKGFWDFAIQYFLESWHTGHIAINNSMDLSNPNKNLEKNRCPNRTLKPEKK